MFSDCEDCGREHEGDCPIIHGPLVIIEDTKVRCWPGWFGLLGLNTLPTCKPDYSYGVAGINNNHGRLRLKKNDKVILLRF